MLSADDEDLSNRNFSQNPLEYMTAGQRQKELATAVTDWRGLSDCGCGFAGCELDSAAHASGDGTPASCVCAEKGMRCASFPNHA